MSNTRKYDENTKFYHQVTGQIVTMSDMVAAYDELSCSEKEEYGFNFLDYFEACFAENGGVLERLD